MMKPDWQLKAPIDTIIFDCDSTLTRLEGIDELARYNNVGDTVARMTAQAMSTSGMNPDLFKARLELIKPTYKQMKQLSLDYFNHRSLDVIEMLEILKKLEKNIFIVSSGLNPSVTDFGKQLHIPAENIFAVNLKFSADGTYLDFDHSSPLIQRDGKRTIVAEIKKTHPRIVYIGDGMNDLEATDLCERFIGYGGVEYRHHIAERC
ncbi:MAG TPA: HAD-IB family phosphatase, partial [Gammaproteobacteria bacterium]|nr:HAD-IB family phosphatase [Gammaproteobacteria bacterium]